jgi:DNA-binding winged helix-turn-helix (wHTH) protein/Tol biopolymer transport system component
VAKPIANNRLPGKSDPENRLAFSDLAYNEQVMDEAGLGSNDGIRFGRFILFPDARTLLKSGREIRIQAQPLSLLCILAARPGEVITRAELHALLWPGVEFLDFEAALNSTVKKLRQALDDDAGLPRFIRTVPKPGYMFIGLAKPAEAPSDLVTPAGAPTAAATAEVTSPPPPALAARLIPKLVAALAILAALAVGAALAAQLFSVRNKLLPLNGVRYTLNSEADSVADAAISPDGRYLAFADQYHVQVMATADRAANALPKLDRLHISGVSWFPDSSNLLLSGLDGAGDGHALWRVSILGDQEPLQLFSGAVDGRMSPDGKHYAVISEDRRKVRIAPADRSETHIVAQADGIGQVFWSDDSTRVFFTSREGWVYRLHSVAIAGGEPVSLIGNISENSVALLPQGRLLYCVNPLPGASDLFEMTVDPSTGKQRGSPVQIQHSDSLLDHLTVTSDGSRIAYLQGEQQAGIWTGDLSDDNARLTDLRRLTLTEGDSYPHGWTADSQSVLFESQSVNKWNVFRQTVGVAERQPLLFNLPPAVRPISATGGKWLLYQTLASQAGAPGGGASVMRAPFDGGAPAKLYTLRANGSLRCSTQPDRGCVMEEDLGSKQTFSRLDPADGKTTAWTDYSSGRQVEDWDLSPDGSTIAILERGDNENTLHLIAANGAITSLSFPGTHGLKSVNWWANGRGFFCAARERDAYRMLSISRNGQVSVLNEDVGGMPSWATPSPDGRRLALVLHRRHYNAWVARVQ